MAYPPMGAPQPMGAPPPAPGGGTPSRPNTVTVAAGLMLALAAVAFINSALSLVVMGHVDEVVRASAPAGSGGALSVASTIGKFAPIVEGIVAVVLFAWTAIMNLRGRSWARVVGFVIGGLGVVCCGCSAVSTFGTMGASSTLYGGASIYPGWYQGIAGSLQILAVLASGAVIILLALRASGEYYAAVSAGGRQAVPDPAYPGQPVGGYPPNPGYPAPGYPPQPGYPGRPNPPAQPGYPPAGPQDPGTPQGFNGPPPPGGPTRY